MEASSDGHIYNTVRLATPQDLRERPPPLLGLQAARHLGPCTMYLDFMPRAPPSPLRALHHPQYQLVPHPHHRSLSWPGLTAALSATPPAAAPPTAAASCASAGHQAWRLLSFMTAPATLVRAPCYEAPSPTLAPNHACCAPVPCTKHGCFCVQVGLPTQAGRCCKRAACPHSFPAAAHNPCPIYNIVPHLRPPTVNGFNPVV